MYDKTKALIVGQGEVNEAMLHHFASRLSVIALDGAAHFLTAQKIAPDVIIGDMDSLADKPFALGDAKQIQITEQDSNDFEKALYHLAPKQAVGIGLFGKRFDQAMANLHVMAKYHHQSKIIAVTNDEIITIHKGESQLAAKADGLVAIIPLAPMAFTQSTGLLYPLDGLTLGFGAMISSSNQATKSRITITPESASAEVAYALCRPLSLLEEQPIEAL